jgi:hypothetical protein
VLALGALMLGACRVPYHPVTPREAATDGVSAGVVKVSVGGFPKPQLAAFVRFGAGFVGGFAAPPAPPLAAAWLAPEGSPRCAAGVRALENGSDPFSSEGTTRELTFDGSAVEAAGLIGRTPTVLDVEVLPTELAGPRRCLRLPLADATPEPAWAARSRWFLGTSLRLIAPAAGAHDDVGDGALFSFYGGVWLGPARLRLDWLIGDASTQHPSPTGYGRAEAELLGGAASIEWFPLRAGAFGLGVNLGYEWLRADFHATAGNNEWDDYAFGPRGPRAMLRFARVPKAPTWPGFWNRRDGWAAGIDLSVARWTGPGSLAATFVGVGVGIDTGYWW